MSANQKEHRRPQSESSDRHDLLIIDEDARLCSPPHMSGWIDLSNRKTPFRLLMQLANQHLRAPGTPIPTRALCRATWPGECSVMSAVTNRLYVTISMLRRQLGQDLIVSHPEGGYQINERVIIVFCDDEVAAAS